MLNEDHSNTYRDLLILSSLKVHCGIKFGPRPPDWEALTDLATYFVYGKSEHAPIQPFQYVVSNYAPDRYVNINHVYFNDPSRFIHIGKNETLAVSEKELAEGNILAQGLDQLESLPNRPEYQERLQEWRKHFLDSSTCSSCPAWRLCLGNFDSHISPEMSCRDFFY